MTFLFISLLFLVGLFALSSMASALKKLHELDNVKALGKIHHLFPQDTYDGILFSINASQNVARFICLTSGALFAYFEGFLNIPFYFSFPLAILLILLFYLFSDYVPKLLGTLYPSQVLSLSGIIASPFLLLSYPLAYLFISKGVEEPMHEVRHEIFKILQEAKISPKLTLHDKKLFASVIYFQNRIAREVMIPRINIFSLEGTTTIEEAVRLLKEEGYSRVPVYKDTIDNIIGVLMYKDILNQYIEYQEKANNPAILKEPIESIVKPVMYAPETKKISNLLQDFRKKQMHLAIIVDEYGGTAGIVTIEDILEEIVGEIEDEYDAEEDLFHPISENVWIVDAKMSIIDAKEQLKISIPQEGDYDTIGGYIFHRAGAIPSKGFTIKLDTIELEVLRSNDRKVEKVKIKRKNL